VLAPRATQEEIHKARDVWSCDASCGIHKKGDIASQRMLEKYVVHKLKESSVWYVKEWMVATGAETAIRVGESFLNRDCLVPAGQEAEIGQAVLPFLRGKQARQARGKNMEWELIHVNGDMSYFVSKNEWSQRADYTVFFLKKEKVGFEHGDKWTFKYEVNCNRRFVLGNYNAHTAADSLPYIRYRNWRGEWNSKRGRDFSEEREKMDSWGRRSLGIPSVSMKQDQKYEAIYRYWCTPRRGQRTWKQVSG